MRKKIKRSLFVIGSLSLFFSLCTSGVGIAQDQTPPDNLEQIKESMSEMKKTMAEQDRKIKELEKAQGKDLPPEKKPTGKSSPIKYRDTFIDRQAAASRLDHYTMDPEYKGFIPVPNTDVMIRFNARPRVDATYDNRTPGNDDRFVTAKIPVRGDSNYDGDPTFNMNSKASHLSFEAVAPELPGSPRFFYENDFFGGGSNEYEYRIKHLYGEVHNFIIGHTFSVFEDPDIWPDTVDFEGPNSMVWARWPVIQYMYALDDEFSMKFSVEQPDAVPSSIYDMNGDVSEDVDGSNSAPDGGFNLRWARPDVGHAQFGSVIRYIGARSATYGEENVVGWGTNLSASFEVFEKDTVLGQVTYGQGIGRYGNDTSFLNSDAAFDKDGDLEALKYFGGFVGYTHNWDDRWRSTATYGYVNLGNENSMGPDAYDETYYASVNVVCKLYRKLSLGFECLYGKREVQDGSDGEVIRLQMGLMYKIF